MAYPKTCAAKHIRFFSKVDGNLPIEVSDSDDFSAHVIIESVYTVGVDKTITDPASGLHSLLNLSDYLSK